eukprot:snap_masked-scaffold_9-processed-gene-1.8-mRNA-1 protein AED:1.00 eAED:1.00 QI:0/-1/0/0/-1/1/1/0/63
MFVKLLQLYRKSRQGNQLAAEFLLEQKSFFYLTKSKTLFEVLDHELSNDESQKYFGSYHFEDI